MQPNIQLTACKK